MDSKPGKKRGRPADKGKAGKAGKPRRGASDRRTSSAGARGQDRGRRPPAPGAKGSKRPFSGAKKGRLGKTGDKTFAAGLAFALNEAGGRRGETIEDSLTHPLHSYPARMHPATARVMVANLREWGRPVALLDPFCGSGTTLVEARAAGARALGFDANRLAVEIARVKSDPKTKAYRERLGRVAGSISADALRAGKEARRAGAEPAEHRVIPGVDAKRRERELSGWFPRHVRRELETLAGAIDCIAKDDPLHPAMTVCLSAILHKVSHRRSDADGGRTRRSIARGAAARLFLQRVELLAAGLADMAASSRGPAPIVEIGDARQLAPGLPLRCAVLTSPPYPGTYDYSAHHELRMSFFGITLKHFNKRELGARRSFVGDAAQQQQALTRWRRDYKKTLAVMAEASGGELCALLVGDSVAGSRGVFAVDEIEQLIPKTWEVVARAWQERPQLGAREKRAFASRGKHEHLVLLAPR